jgi:hypothetical protein
MKVKVRPFQTIVDYGPDPLPAAGRIVGTTYLLTVGSAEFPLAAVEVGADERGSFALIEEHEAVVPGGARLSVEVEAPGELAADLPVVALDSVITLYTLPPEAETLKAEHPYANVVVPRSSCVTFYFTCTGALENAGKPQPGERRHGVLGAN